MTSRSAVPMAATPFRRLPPRYEPTLWGIAFPLGMYTTGTLQLSRALDLPFLAAVPAAFIYLALVAWGLAFRGRRA